MPNLFKGNPMFFARICSCVTITLVLFVHAERNASWCVLVILMIVAAIFVFVRVYLIVFSRMSILDLLLYS